MKNITVLKNTQLILFKLTGVFCFLFLNFSNATGEDLRRIYISDNYASYMYFPENMKRAELGVPDDIDAKIEGNTLKITALEEFNYPTNLTVYSENGSVYAFFVHFQKTPKTLYYSVEVNEKLNTRNITGPKPYVKTPKEIEVEKKKQKEKEIEKLSKLQEDSAIVTNCEAILENFSAGAAVSGDQKGGVTFLLYSVLAKNNYLYFIVSFENISKIDYKIENIFTSETSKRKKIKRSATINSIIKPYLIYDNTAENGTNLVKADGGKKLMVLAFKRFTIDTDKLLEWEVYEVGGERNLKARINAKTFYRASDF